MALFVRRAWSARDRLEVVVVEESAERASASREFMRVDSVVVWRVRECTSVFSFAIVSSCAVTRVADGVVLVVVVLRPRSVNLIVVSPFALVCTLKALRSRLRCLRRICSVCDVGVRTVLETGARKCANSAANVVGLWTVLDGMDADASLEACARIAFETSSRLGRTTKLLRIRSMPLFLPLDAEEEVRPIWVRSQRATVEREGVGRDLVQDFW